MNSNLRTSDDYLRSLRDGRRVYVDGQCVSDVTAHPALFRAAQSLANLYDIAAAPENRELMTFTSPKTGKPVLRAYQIPKTHEDLRARRLAAEAWAESTFGLMGRSPDHVAGFFCGYARFQGASRSVGVDNTRLFVDRARQRFPDCEFHLTGWDSLPDGTFDVILLASALHYADDQPALIHRLVEKLSPDGVLVLELGIYSSGKPEWVKVQR